MGLVLVIFVLVVDALAIHDIMVGESDVDAEVGFLAVCLLVLPGAGYWMMRSRSRIQD